MSTRISKTGRYVIRRGKTDYAKILQYKDQLVDHKMVCEDYALTPYASATTNDNVCLLNRIREGTGQFNRVGRVVALKGLTIRIRFTLSGTFNANADVQRIIFVFDRQPSAAASLPIIDLILKNYDAAGTAATNVFSELNPDNSHRFIILRDMSWMVQGNPATTPPSTPTVVSLVIDNKPNSMQGNLIRDYIDLTGLTTVFNGTAAPVTISQITSGALYACMIGNQAQASAVWNMRCVTRLTYCDN